jgi:hypothetical protein
MERSIKSASCLDQYEVQVSRVTAQKFGWRVVIGVHRMET